MTEPQLRRGAEAAKEATKSVAFAKTHYLSLGDGEQVVLRFLIDASDIITVQQHQMIPTKGAPAGFDGHWPPKMGAVCRRDVAFAGMYDDCFICDNGLDRNDKSGKVQKPGARTWTFACIREPVFEETEFEGKKIQVIKGYRNKMREVAVLGKDNKPTGENTTEPEVVVVNLGYKNFMGILVGHAGVYGTILDRDYHIKREGKSTDTAYRVVPLEPINMKNGDRFDLRNPEYLKRYGFESADAAYEALSNIVVERSSDEYYARFFDTRVVVSAGGEVSADPNPQPAAPSGDTDEKRLAELSKRVKGYAEPSSNGGEAKTPPQPAPEPEAPKTPAKASSGMQNFDE